MSTTTQKPMGRVAAFFGHDAAPGVILLAAALFALILNNSSLAWLYDGLLETPMTVRVGAIGIDKPLLLWINDGLMAVFFFFVALEIKREIVQGELSSVREASLPAAAAVGGMIVPALVFVGFNWGNADAMQGWAIPAATDIAFALGVLALLGKAAPPALKIFLLSLAIIDDLGAIVIIAAFYTDELSVLSLSLGGFGVATLFVLNRLGVRRVAPYVVVGIAMWVCVLKSGVHATLAGVVLGLFIPISADAEGRSPLLRLEHGLQPWVAYAIMPIFAFANAGVALGGISLSDLLDPLPLGIALGLFAGKQIGVFGFAYAAVRSGLCRMPRGITFAHLYGVALLAGIGFTMSLFIGTLAFDNPEHGRAVRIGVLSGSLISAVAGYAMIRWASRRVTERLPAMLDARAS